MAPTIASLGTTLRDARPAWFVALLVLAFDMATLAPDVTAYDSAELAMAGAQLGLSHPIGQPVHTLLAAVFARLSIVTPLVGMGLLSALFHALTVVPACSLAEQLAIDPAAPRAPGAAALRAATIGAVLLAAPVWECATRVEVYALSTFGVTWAAAHAASLGWERVPSPRRALVLGVALGLSASVNAYHAMLAALALTPLAVRMIARRLEEPAEPTMRAIGLVIGGGALGLTPYAYVPLVGGRTDVVVWGAPTTLEGLSAYFRGDDYGHNRGTTLAEWWDHFGQWLEWAAQTPVLAVLILGASAHLALGRDRGAGREASALLSASTVALLCSHRVFHVAITDYQNYLAPALAIAAAGLAAATHQLALARPAFGAAAFVILFAVCGGARPALWQRTRAHDHALGTASRGALTEAPEGAFLIVRSDHWAAPMLYLQEVENLRPDVVLVIEGLTSSSWYWAHVRRRHPDLPDFELAGPGERVGRIRRLLDAAPDRPVAVEDDALARELELTVCDVGFLAMARHCGEPGLDADGATRDLARAMTTIDRGSPSSDEALAAIALGRGDALLRLGRTERAVAALAAGVPASLSPPTPSEDDLRALASVPALELSFEWSQPAALSDARRAVFLEGLVFRAAQRPIGDALVGHAAQLGLAEARE